MTGKWNKFILMKCVMMIFIIVLYTWLHCVYMMRGCISKESKINNEKKKHLEKSEWELEAHAFDLINEWCLMRRNVPRVLHRARVLISQRRALNASSFCSIFVGETFFAIWICSSHHFLDLFSALLLFLSLSPSRNGLQHFTSHQTSSNGTSEWRWWQKLKIKRKPIQFLSRCVSSFYVVCLYVISGSLVRSDSDFFSQNTIA